MSARGAWLLRDVSAELAVRFFGRLRLDQFSEAFAEVLRIIVAL
jgi:hypothetical protein